MKKSTTKTINGEALVTLFEKQAEEILSKEKKAPKKKATKKVVEKSEVKEPKKKTVKAPKKADTVEKVEKDSEKSQSTEKPKKVVKKAPKAEKTAEKEPKKTTKKAKAEEVEQEAKEQELRQLETIKIAKVEYAKCENIKTYEDLSKAIENGDDVYVAFDISSVKPSEYENIFHVPFSKDMKDNFDICQPIFICEKNPRLVFASLYTEALWDLFPDEFNLLSAVLIEEPKAKK